jgi:hypothetical protein
MLETKFCVPLLVCLTKSFIVADCCDLGWSCRQEGSPGGDHLQSSAVHQARYKIQDTFTAMRHSILRHINLSVNYVL